MITTDQYAPTTLKCSRSGKRWTVPPFGYHLAPMCNKCHTYQTLCDDCEKKGCIGCGAEMGWLLH